MVVVVYIFYSVYYHVTCNFMVVTKNIAIISLRLL